MVVKELIARGASTSLQTGGLLATGGLLVGPIVTRPVQDPLAVLLLNNPLYI